VVNSLTKPLAEGRFEILRECLVLVVNTFLAKGEFRFLLCCLAVAHPSVGCPSEIPHSREDCVMMVQQQQTNLSSSKLPPADLLQVLCTVIVGATVMTKLWCNSLPQQQQCEEVQEQWVYMLK
jgi:hypothetical protein